MRLCFVFLATLSLALSAAAAAENPYDMLGRTLAPIVNLFVSEARSPNRALSTEATLVEMTKLPPEHAGAKVRLALQHPDKLLLSAPILGEPVAVCRRGQEVWAHPGAKIEALINGLGELPKLRKKYRFEDFSLPFPEQNLVFLPVLFKVQDGGEETLSGVSCRVLHVALMPELAQSLEVEEWSARLWVRAGYQIAQLRLMRPGWSVTVKLDRTQFSPALPTETWLPAVEQTTDVLRLDPPRFRQVAEAVGRAMRSR